MGSRQDISEVYASHLQDLHKGYALWFPEGYDGSDEINIGDVGYIRKGNFIEVFKAKYTRDDALNQRNVEGERVPPSHQPIPPQALNEVLTTTQYMTPNMYHGKSLLSKTITSPQSGDDAGHTLGSLRRSLTFSEQGGANLYIPQIGIETTTETSYGLIEYMKKYHDSWYDYVAGSGPLRLAIGRSDLIMIQGFVKTSAFAMTAARPGSTLNGFALESQVVTSAGVSLDISYNLTQQSGVESREPKLDDSSPRWPIFIRYLQVRCRTPEPHSPVELHAGNGPGASGLGVSVEVQNDSYADGLESVPENWYEYVIEPNLPEISAHSWVDILLDYLLENSDAAMAIACHGDVYSLFPEGSPPEDFREHLKMVQPKIRVDSDKFATLDLLTLINRRRVQQITGNDAVPDSNAEADAGADVTDQGNDTDARARYGGLVLGCAASSSEQLPWAHLTIVNGGDANPVTVTSMSVSPDGTQVAASYEDDVIQLWDAKAGMLITSLDGSQEEGVGRHEAFVWTTVYSPDGKYLASGGEDGRILVWAAQDIPQEDSTIIRRGKVISNMDAHDIDVWKLAFSSDGETIASGSVGGEVKLWNALTGHCKHELSGHLAPVQDVKFTPDGAHLVTSAEEIATIWSVETGAKMVDMRGHANTVWTVAVSHAGDRVMTGSEDGTCRIWDMASGEALVILAEHGGPVWSIGWSEDDKQVLSGSDDGSAMIWDSHTGTLLHTLTPDGDATSVVGVVAWSPLGNAVCTGSSDGAIRLWDSDSGSLLAEWRGHGDKVKGVEFTSDGRNIYSACDDSSIRHWSVTDVMRLY